MTNTPDFLAQLDAIRVQTNQLFVLPADRLIQQPAPGRWSALQCFEHLTLSAQMYIPAIDAAVREAKLKGLMARGPFRYSLFERFLVRGTEPPPRIKVPAPKKTSTLEPPQDVEVVRQAYHDSHMAMQRCISEALAVDLGKVKVKSQLPGRPSLNAGITIGLMLAHERRHLYQAQKAAQ